MRSSGKKPTRRRLKERIFERVRNQRQAERENGSENANYFLSCGIKLMDTIDRSIDRDDKLKIAERNKYSIRKANNRKNGMRVKVRNKKRGGERGLWRIFSVD